jgi:hypothetical protein
LSNHSRWWTVAGRFGLEGICGYAAEVAVGKDH